METPSDSSGQRLRWWTDAAPQTQKWYSEPLAPVEEALSLPATQTLSLEEELEAEAMRRAALERDAVIITGDLASESKAQRWDAWALLFALLTNLTVGIISHSWVNMFLSLVLIAEYLLLTAITRKQFAAHKPQVVVSALGLTVDMPYYRIGPVFWSEIASVRVVDLKITKYVQVTLRNPKETFKRSLSVRPSPLGWLIHLTGRGSCIEIADQSFPQSAGEIAATIANFRPADAE